MMEKELKAPKLRFPGFTDDWEQRKVTELLKNTSDAIKIGPFGSALKKNFFTDKGIKNTSIQEIVDNANVAKGTFYLYFKDKYELQDILITSKSENKNYNNESFTSTKSEKINMINRNKTTII